MPVSNTVVIVVDVQVGLIDGPQPVYDGCGVVERIKQLTDRARLRTLPVIYVQDDDVGPVGGAEWQLHPALGVSQDDLRLRKAYADSFHRTQLHELLTSHGVRRLIVAGCKTDACVEMTCRRAVSLGYDVVLVGDGHTTTDNRFMTAQQTIAYYNIVLDGFGSEDGFGEGEREIVVQAAADIAL